MSIERGQLGKLEDTTLLSSTPQDGSTLVYNSVTSKWEPKLGGGQADIGNPSDGTFSDGIMDWQPTTKVADALDNLNELVAQMAPANAISLAGTTLSGAPTNYSAKIPSGLSTNWFKAGKNPGDTITNAVKTTKSAYVTPNATTTFNNADKGLLKLYINDILKATIDLESNFQEANRSSSQNISSYNVKGNGDVISAGIVTFDVGNFKITSVAKYNNFTMWQKGNATVNITSELLEGYNNIYLVHELPGSNQVMNKLELYFDDDISAMSFTAAPVITEKTTVGKYLSGVKYYTTGDSFNVNYTISNLFKKLYNSTKVSDYSMPGVSTITKNPLSVPGVSDTFNVSDVAVAINASNIMTNNAVITAKAYDPYNNTVTSTSGNEGRLILTYPQRSTNIAEYFTDEIYRLPLGFDFNSTTASFSNNWNSGVSLVNGNAQCYLNGSNASSLIYPSANFSTGFVPVNTANYNGFSGNQQYARAFIASNSQSSVVFTLNGFNGVLGQVGLGDINIEVKLPGLSGWGDALKPYDSAANKSVDGWGMLAGSVNGGVFTATFGGLSTVNSNSRIYVRITLRNQNAYIGSVVVGW